MTVSALFIRPDVSTSARPAETPVVTPSAPERDGWPFRAANIAPPPGAPALGYWRPSVEWFVQNGHVVIKGDGEVRLDPGTARALGQAMIAAAVAIENEIAAQSPGDDA